MKITNVRLGFAANSSSTHSMIFIDNAAQYDNIEEPQFGWDLFTASTALAKKQYLQTCLYQNFVGLFGESIGRIVSEELCPDIRDAVKEDECYVDHQSGLTFPCSFDPAHPNINLDFFNEFQDYIANNPQIAILGGNDNDDESHPLTGEEFNPMLPVENRSKSFIARKNTNHWTLFNRNTGAKTRLSLGNEDVLHSSLPELVDLKITDWCDVGCKFCYQSSTTKGIHAELQDIKRILNVLAAAEVFEVALGGGETTDHPDFAEIVRYAANLGIKPNFTTRKQGWIEQDWGYEVIDLCGAFAYSVGSPQDVQSILRWSRLDKSKINIQIPMGTIDRDSFEKVIGLCFLHDLSVTLLGYKTTGFGGDYKRIDYSWWMEVVEECVSKTKWKRGKVGVDTVIVQEYGGLFEEKGFPKEFYYASEGTFSCYIDAVKKEIAPSSFCEESERKALKVSEWGGALDFNLKELEEAFQQMNSPSF